MSRTDDGSAMIREAERSSIKAAEMCSTVVGDFDEVMQVCRIAAWRASLSYDASKAPWRSYAGQATHAALMALLRREEARRKRAKRLRRTLRIVGGWAAT